VSQCFTKNHANTNHANCEVQLVILFLNTKSILPAEFDQQFVLGKGVTIRGNVLKRLSGHCHHQGFERQGPCFCCYKQAVHY
jgi:hypothetical protein